MKKRLFVDIDGTLAHFNKVQKIEALYEQGYFLSLPPYQNVVDAIKIINKRPDVDVFILSAVLSDSKYALDEKTEWISKYLPEIKSEQLLFTVCGKDKADFIKGGITKSDILLDDYTINLYNWSDKGGQGIKLVNEINSTHGTWKGKRVKYNAPANMIAELISEEIKKAPEPVISNTLKRVVFECTYLGDDNKQSKVFIVAYDKLDAECNFCLYMKDTDKLVKNSIKQTNRKEIKGTDKCLNFKNPNTIAER